MVLWAVGVQIPPPTRELPAETQEARHPERARRYSSADWQRTRQRHLRANPTCVVCGQSATDVDHVIAVSPGGSFDGQLLSMCAKHHHEKTVRDSHEAPNEQPVRGGTVAEVAFESALAFFAAVEHVPMDDAHGNLAEAIVDEYGEDAILRGLAVVAALIREATPSPRPQDRL